MSIRGIRKRLAGGLRPILLGSLTLAGLATVLRCCWPIRSPRRSASGADAGNHAGSPLIPGLLAAGLLPLSLAMDDSVMSNVTAGESVTLPLELAGAFQREVTPRIQGLATLVIPASVVLLALASPPRDDIGHHSP